MHQPQILLYDVLPDDEYKVIFPNPRSDAENMIFLARSINESSDYTNGAYYPMSPHSFFYLCFSRLRLLKTHTLCVFLVVIALHMRPASFLESTLCYAALTSEDIPETVTDEQLLVAVKETPPFSFLDKDRQWQGLSVALWKRIATKLDIDYRFEETPLENALAGLANGSYDVAVGALTVTSDRERDFDYSHPFYLTGLGIAVAKHRQSDAGWLPNFYMPSRLIIFMFCMCVAPLAIAFIVYLFEKTCDSSDDTTTVKGYRDAVWWAVVTMTTVGYGDKVPRTHIGRYAAVAWMLSSIFLISGFTGAVASSLTVEHLTHRIRGPEDLAGKKVGAIRLSTGADWLKRRGIPCILFDDMKQGADALTRGRLDAFVNDRPVLIYFATWESWTITVLPGSFENQFYAFGIKEGDPRRESINRVLLSTMESDWWRNQIARFRGEND